MVERFKQNTFPQVVTELPMGECWMVVEDWSYQTEADERSKHHPGHGYPATNYKFAKVTRVFYTEKDFKEHMESLLLKNEAYGVHVRGFHCFGIDTTLEKSVAFRDSSREQG